MAGINWPDVWTGTIIAATSAIVTAAVTAPWWLRLARPLTTLCKTQLFRAKVEQDNAGRLNVVENKVVINGEQTAIAIHQNKVILELLESATMQADALGRVNWVSHRWTNLAGIQRDEAIGDGWLSAIRADDQDRVIQRYTRAVERGQPLNEDFHFVTGQWVRMTMEPIRYDGKLVAWVSEFDRLSRSGIPVEAKPVTVVPQSVDT